MARSKQTKSGRSKLRAALVPHADADEDWPEVAAWGMSAPAASQLVLSNEDAGVFDELRGRYHDELQPRGQVEASLVDRLVEVTWRLGRIARIEAGVLRSTGPNEVTAYLTWRRELASLSQYEAGLVHYLTRILRLLRELQAGRVEPLPEGTPLG